MVLSNQYESLEHGEKILDLVLGFLYYSWSELRIRLSVNSVFEYLLASAGTPASMQTSTKGPKPMADFLLLARPASSSHCRVFPKALRTKRTGEGSGSVAESK